MDLLLPIITRSIMGNTGFYYYPLLTSPTCRCSARRRCAQRREMSVQHLNYKHFFWWPSNLRTAFADSTGYSMGISSCGATRKNRQDFLQYSLKFLAETLPIGVQMEIIRESVPADSKLKCHN